MSVSKIFFAGIITVTSLGLATAGQAQERISCLDGSVATGDCIPVYSGQGNAWGVQVDLIDDSSSEAAPESSSTTESSEATTGS